MDRLFELHRKLAALEQAHSLLVEEHRQCAPRPTSPSHERAWAYRIFLEAIGAAYRNAAPQYHPDRHGDTQAPDDPFKALAGAYAELRAFIRSRGV
jgi:hypothetical protein